MDINADFHYLALLTLSKGTYVIQRYLRYPKVLTLSKGTYVIQRYLRYPKVLRYTSSSNSSTSIFFTFLSKYRYILLISSLLIS